MGDTFDKIKSAEGQNTNINNQSELARTEVASKIGPDLERGNPLPKEVAKALGEQYEAQNSNPQIAEQGKLINDKANRAVADAINEAYNNSRLG